MIASVNLSTIAGNTSLDDQRGHGTFVAGIAAGAAPDLAGAAPGSTARLGQGDERPGPGEDVRRHHGGSVDPRQQGRSTTSALRTSRCTRATARTSIVTRSIRQSRSCGSAVSSWSLLPATTASATGPSGVLYAPGNDPFVITVGAVDLGNSLWARRRHRRTVLGLRLHAGRLLQAGRRGSRAGTWSARSRPARRSTAQKASNIVGNDRIQLSGTSFAAPIVAGTVAQMLARHPGWTPDQVKGALMRTARKVVERQPEGCRSR